VCFGNLGFTIVIGMKLGVSSRHWHKTWGFQQVSTWNLGFLVTFCCRQMPKFEQQLENNKLLWMFLRKTMNFSGGGCKTLAYSGVRYLHYTSVDG
jgi:hypothetical protein